MLRVTELPPERAPRRIGQAEREAFEEWFAREFEDALTGRRQWEYEQRRSLRLYEGEPRIRERNFPIKKAPNLVVPLAGIATDNVYSAVVDLIFGLQPVLTCRATQSQWEADARALQRWVDHSVEVRWGLSEAAQSALHDVCRGGTGFYYVPFETRARKLKFYEVVESSPRIRAWPPEDVFEPAGSFGNLQDLEWVAVRHWLTDYQLADRAELEKWKRAALAEPTPRRVGDAVKAERERGAKTHSVGQRAQRMYEILEVWAVFDIDGDGVGEDLYAVFDVTTRRALTLRYNPYDRKPLAVMNFQKRAHMLRGAGIPELLRTIQDAGSDILSYWVTNMFLANTRAWAGPPGANREMEEIYPGKYVAMQNADQVREFRLSDVYPSGPMALQIVQLLASRRIGEPALAEGRGGRFGSRTPGITALTQVQQEVQRFAAAFKNIRDGTAEAVRQALYREQEQLLRGNVRLLADLRRVLGDEDGERVAGLLRSEHFDEQVAVELTAGSPSLNKEADKQNAILLIDRMFAYYMQALQLAQLNEQLPEGSPTKAMTRQVLEKANSFIVKMLQTFDQVRDPLSYVVALEEAKSGATRLPGAIGAGQDPVAAILELLGAQGGGTQGTGVERLAGAAGIPEDAAGTV